jgi:SAM-dependent methyltransferase
MKRSAALEMMDVPGQPRELLAADLRNLRLLNRYLGCYRTVINGVARIVDERRMRRFSLLDAGAGSGDVSAAIVYWARSRGIAARISGLEREAITMEQAVAHTRAAPEIAMIQGDAAAAPFHDGAFDFVLASQLLHHFSDEQIIELLRAWARLARRAIIVADLVRHPVAYHGVRLLTRACTRNEMTRCDAPLSVQRACTIAEWRELMRRANVGAFTIEWAMPFRVLGVISLEGRA